MLEYKVNQSKEGGVRERLCMLVYSYAHVLWMKYSLEVTDGTLEKRNIVKWVKYILIHNFLEASWLLIETFVYFIEQ